MELCKGGHCCNDKVNNLTPAATQWEHVVVAGNKPLKQRLKLVTVDSPDLGPVAIGVAIRQGFRAPQFQDFCEDVPNGTARKFKTLTNDINSGKQTPLLISHPLDRTT